MIYIIFQDELRQYLLSVFPDARSVSGHKEVLLRCRFCGDSSNTSHAHLYISLGYDNKPPMFNCFKCGEKGLLTPNTLRELGLYDYTITDKLVQFHKNMSARNPRVYRDADVYYINNSFIRNDPVSYKKLDYINSRLGLSLSFKDTLKDKIVLNLCDLLRMNRISPTVKDNFLTELDEHFVGFLSEDNNFFIARNIDSQLDIRYHKYNIHGKISTDKRYYILPYRLDIADPRPIDVHIAEGPFDILSIKYNVPKQTDRNIYAAIGGKAYKNIVRHLISHMGLFNINIHLYADADIQDYVIFGIAKYIEPFNMNIYLHRNGFQGEKDYGVPKDHIVDNVVQISRRV